MADYLNNVLANDAYSDALTLGPNYKARTATVTVSAAPALMQFAVGSYGKWRWLDEREWNAPAGADTINSFKVSNILGIRFRNAIPGQRAQIICTLSDDSAGSDDPVFESGLISAGTIATSGAVKASSMITGIVSCAVGGPVAIVAGSGFTVVRNGVGDYTVTFTAPSPFASRPIIEIASTFDGGAAGSTSLRFPVVTECDVNHFRVAFTAANGGPLTDSGFDFTASPTT